MAYKDFPDEEIEQFGRKATWLDVNQAVIADALRIRIDRLGISRVFLANPGASAEYSLLTEEGRRLKMQELDHLIAQTQQVLESFLDLMGA